MRQITTYTDAHNNKIVSLTESINAWNEMLSLQHWRDRTLVSVGDDGVCNICKGWGERNFKGYGWMYCSCYVLDQFKQMSVNLHPFRSDKDSTCTLKNFKIWGSNESQDSLIVAKDFITAWMKWPEKWIVLLGMYGVGKSHLLQAIANQFDPHALYITASDFESKCFRAMKGFEEYSIEDMVKHIENVPILLLDDLGTEYGSDFPVSLLRRIIQYRYTRPKEWITVVASNVAVKGLYEYDGRIADRLMDSRISKQLMFNGVASWRRYGNSTK